MVLLFLLLLLWVVGSPVAVGAAAPEGVSVFQAKVQPVLVEYCYDCHGEGMNKGKVSFDAFESTDEILGQRELWLAVLKNVRAGLMPPHKKPRPPAEAIGALETWVKGHVFGLDPNDPDPGRVTIRRLNRTEYRNTIRDLTGYDFKVEDELPPDDTGYGFDNIGDVLTMSPLLLEKYMQAAETIAMGSVPRVAWEVPEQAIAGAAFRAAEGGVRGERLSFYEPVVVSHPFEARQAGPYRIALELEVLGQFDFDPGRCRLVLKAGEEELWRQEFGWQNGKRFTFDIGHRWERGEHRLALEVQPLVGAEQKKNSLDLRVHTVRVQGPLDDQHRVRPARFDLFFTKDPPTPAVERRAYAREVLGRFARRAYRRPVEAGLVERLVSLAEGVYTQPGQRFEDGIAQALVPLLASPGFLFRIEESEASASSQRHPLISEHALASRLSYFLWSTMPDEELFGLADRGQLRANLTGQVRRMLADRRSRALVENFVGQWLQVRDVEGIDINARVVLARDSGQERDFDRRRRRFQELVAIPEEQRTPEQRQEFQQLIDQRRRRLNNRQNIELDRDLRRALRDETEMCFAHLIREDRSVLELIQSDYTFLNERLARHYGLTNLNVTGPEMRRVSLPEDSPRGGILTHGSVLVVTSNPTRTSPVKRGLFILDNILGTPPPPPPADVPLLEEAEKEFKERQPTLRETLDVHRRNPLCHSCHNRMDPLGLALENFNALGMWRDQERQQPIDATGQLITGEPFRDIREVKRILASNHRLDFYRCLAEKLLTFALGRGLEYYDLETVDRVVSRIDRENGRFSALLLGVIESAPFQKSRSLNPADGVPPAPPASQRAAIEGPP